MRATRIQPKVSKMQALGLVWGNSDSVTVDLEEVRTRISSPTQYGARLLLDHWRACEAEGGFVVGRDVPSRPLAPVLRNVAIYEPLEGASDFRVRIAGTAFMRRFGRDITGLKLSEIYDRTNFAARRAEFAQIVGAGKPEIADVRISRDGRQYLKFEALRLPILSPDRSETWVLAGVFYFDWG